MPAPAEAVKLTKLLRKPLWDGDKEDGKALTSALLTVREGYSRFYAPLDEVATMVLDLFPKKKALRAAMGEIAAKWDDDTRDAFLLVAGYTTHWRTRHDHAYEDQKELVIASTRELCAAVGAPKNTTVRTKLAAWGFGGQKAPKLPKELPVTLEAALAVYAELGLTRDALALGKAGTPAKGAPRPLAAFHRKHATLGSRFIVSPSKLAAETKGLQQWVKMALEDAEGDEVDRGTLHPARLSRRAVAFGSNASGDVYFLDTGLGLEADEPPVLRFVHDEGYAQVEASTLGAFVAGRALEAAFGEGPHAEAVAKLVARDRKRAKLPAALAKAPKGSANDD